MDNQARITKLEAKLNDLNSKLHEANLRENQVLANRGWGYAQRNVKIGFSTTRTDALKVRIKNVKEDIEFYKFIDEKIEALAESHLEAWRERYANYGGNKKRVVEDLYGTHDPSLEIEYCETEIGRPITDKENWYLVSQFNKEVVKQWSKGK
jgi:hypothetical protein